MDIITPSMPADMGGPSMLADPDSGQSGHIPALASNTKHTHRETVDRLYIPLRRSAEEGTQDLENKGNARMGPELAESHPASVNATDAGSVLQRNNRRSFK
ncbi:MAG: hypothetical protein KGQ67_04930 [Betaproteobacteria bacterium]|nr:hypothetical protein [Betaproteobacteria bacterium]